MRRYAGRVPVTRLLRNRSPSSADLAEVCPGKATSQLPRRQAMGTGIKGVMHIHAVACIRTCWLLGCSSIAFVITCYDCGRGLFGCLGGSLPRVGIFHCASRPRTQEFDGRIVRLRVSSFGKMPCQATIGSLLWSLDHFLAPDYHPSLTGTDCGGRRQAVASL